MAENATPRSPAETQVGKNDLPLCCPGPRSELAGLHPRVYLPLKKSGDRATCPYCGAVYVLQ